MESLIALFIQTLFQLIILFCAAPSSKLQNRIPFFYTRAAGLDVWLSEKDPNWALAQHPSVSCTPHIGAGTGEAQKRIDAELVDIIESFS